MSTIHKRITITITMVDVDKQPISNADVTCTWVNASAGTGPSHSTNTFSCELEADIPVDRIDDVRITVNHPNFTTEVTTIHPDGDYWTNPTCIITASVTNAMSSVVEVDMSVTFVLSRARLAPMAVEAISSSRSIPVPSGVLPNNKEAPADTNYRFVFSDERSFLRLREHVIGDPSKDDWERLAHAPPVAADATHEGYFRWIEVREGPKKFAVAIWAPKNYFPQPVQNEQMEALDFIVFYSPTTAGKDDIYKLDRGHTYPYGLRTTPDPKDKTRATDWNQPFIFTLGQKYLFDRLHLTFQLIAANKKAILVMPINAYGDWGPFTHKQGVHRLLLEIAQFSYKNFMAPLGKPPASRRKYRGIPPIGKVVIAGFSSGSVPILELFRDKENVPGLSYVKDGSVFDKLWAEFWDLDLEMEGADKLWMGHFHRFLSAFGRSDRRVRMYHSEKTVGSDNETQKWRPGMDPLVKKLAEQKGPKDFVRSIPNGTDSRNRPSFLVEEYHLLDNRWSVVFLSDEFLSRKLDPKKGDPVPGYDNGGHHDFVAQLGLGHAAFVSGLRNLH